MPRTIVAALLTAAVVALAASAAGASGGPRAHASYDTGPLCGSGCTMSGSLSFTIDESYCEDDEGQFEHYKGSAHVSATYDPSAGYWTTNGSGGSFEAEWGTPAPCAGDSGSGSGSNGANGIEPLVIAVAKPAPPAGGESWELMLGLAGTGTDNCATEGVNPVEVDVQLNFPVLFSAAGTAHVDTTLPWYTANGTEYPNGSFAAAAAGACQGVPSRAVTHVTGDLTLHPSGGKKGGDNGGGAAGGLKLHKGADHAGADGKTVEVGSATNPPTASATVTLTAPGGAHASAAKGHKPVVLGRGKVKVPAGKTVPLKLKLNGKGRAQLKQKGKLTATLAVVAVNSAGEKQTKTARVTIKPHAKHR